MGGDGRATIRAEHRQCSRGKTGMNLLDFACPVTVKKIDSILINGEASLELAFHHF
ncbi:hypothetical protein MPC1_20017 [Methylocella tundrae]|nr:hypothetical protein MPC1_20017 [Methylocella tundrae]